MSGIGWSLYEAGDRPDFANQDRGLP